MIGLARDSAARCWFGIGTAGQRRLDPYPDPGAAISGLASLLGAKHPATIKTGRHETAPLGGRSILLR
jgi:hypothetical protein